MDALITLFKELCRIKLQDNSAVSLFFKASRLFDFLSSPRNRIFVFFGQFLNRSKPLHDLCYAFARVIPISLNDMQIEKIFDRKRVSAKLMQLF